MDTPEDAGMPTKNPSAAIFVREHQGQAFYEAKFRHEGRQVKRRIGRAWLVRSEKGEWLPRKGRVQDGFYDVRAAHVAAAAIVEAYVHEKADQIRYERERRAQGVTFREVAHAYLAWMADVKNAKPSTLADYGYMLGESGVLHKRGEGKSSGHIMSAIGDRPAAKVTTAEVEALLTAIAEGGATARTVNKHRQLVNAIYNYAGRESTFNLPGNPARGADKRAEAHPGVLAFYSVEEVETLARTLTNGEHRATSPQPLTPAEVDAFHALDEQDGAMVRVSAYAGLRLGELLALRWADVDFAGHALTVGRALSAGVESSTKSGRARRVPLPDQAAAALDLLSRREDFTGDDERVFCNALGRTLDASALRRRYRRAQAAAGLPTLRWHDLRHTYGSLLAAKGVDLVTIKDAMGHSALATTGRYLHARPATDQARRFTKAFESASPSTENGAPSRVR